MTDFSIKEGNARRSSVVKKAERWPLIWAAIVTVLLVALAGTFTAYLHASSAIKCINGTLGSRAGVTQKDQSAHIAFADVVLAAVTKHPLTQRDAQAIAGALGVRTAPGKVLTPQDTLLAIRSYRDRLVADQEYRNSKPLGLC